MSSEALLQWMTQYPERILSEQIINRACINIEKAKGRKVDSVKVSKIRRKYLNPLLEFGHIEFANKKGTAYSVMPPILLELRNSHTILCGARTEKLTKEWCQEFKYTVEYGELTSCWIDETIDQITIFPFKEFSKSTISVDFFLKKLPKISPEYLGKKVAPILFDNLKRFNPINNNWESSKDLIAGVYREHDNLPPSAQAWYWIERNQNGELEFIELNSLEATSAALCYASVLEKQVKLNYNKNKQLLDINLPGNVYLPLMLKRPLTWMNVKGGNKLSKSTFNNISNSIAIEIARILSMPLTGE